MRNRFLFLVDILSAVIVAVLAFSARFEGWAWMSTPWADVALRFIVIAVPIKLFIFWRARLYARLWQYASVGDLMVVLAASAASGIATLLVGLVGLPLLQVITGHVPISVLVLDSLLIPAALVLPRLALRHWAGQDRRARVRHDRRVLIVGAGAAGGLIARELQENPRLGLQPIGFIDDDVSKHGHRLRGVPVLGPIGLLTELVSRFEVAEVVIAMPSASGRAVREVVQRSAQAGVPARTVPGLFEILSGAKAVSALRQIEIHDLLRREPIITDYESVSQLARGRTVLVTGAGGSIGSELCRQLARLGPTTLVAVGRGENSIFELVQELAATFPGLPVVPVIVDVRDERRLRLAFERYRPYSVFHAAAHKHVPLMEENVGEAILNNVLGTRNVAELAAEFAVENLVLISTDKAVRPTSVMGATKRLAEAVVHCVADREERNYVAVRFGNVLGSRGSVVPTFMRQIAAGKPITITHPDMTRYFMTIPEAVQLVLQAGAMGRHGDVFLLDMGEPVRIVDLAEDLIRLSGLEVGHDIEILFTGTRPGEKLHEELFSSAQLVEPTEHEKILRARGLHFPERILADSDALIDAAQRCDLHCDLRQMLSALVPEYASSTPVVLRADARTSAAHASADAPRAAEKSPVLVLSSARPR